MESAKLLQFETGQETDDGDPYVCFRRREVRQIRKTRGRDAQSAEKLRRLRKELEDARQLVAFVRQRELARKEMLHIERQIFLQRSQVKDMKRKLGVKDDDEDLINQKVSGTVSTEADPDTDILQPKKKPVEVPTMQRPTAPQLRIPQRPGTQAAEDLQLLEEVQADKENEILRDIKQNLAKHVKWNEGYVDLTTAPLTPSPKKTFSAAFRPAITTQLPTPPSSDSSDNNDNSLDKLHPYFRDRFESMDMDEDASKIPAFRRRIGRGGRMMIDRRNLATRRVDIDPIMLDRFKYDADDDDEDEPVYEHDKYDIQVMQHRAIMAAKARDQALAVAHAQAQVQAQAQAAQAVQTQGQAQRRTAGADQSNAPGASRTGPGSNPGPGAVPASVAT
jgi:enhancer of polycomb-like protein